MKKIIYAIFALLPFVACTEDVVESPTTGDIAGSVSDQTTGEPVATVNVVLNPGGKSTVTGNDGSFSYKDLEPGKYSLEINKKGYKSNTKEILVKEGETSPTHMLIERIPAIVTADKNLLDFGFENSLNTLSFNIVNSSYEDLAWIIEENCDWITQIKEPKGTLKYGKTETIVVIIDRSKLNSGENKTVIVVKSSNGNTEVEVRAIGEHLPVLEIHNATNVKAYSATLHAEITSAGLPEYIERGFVYGTTTNPTLDNCIAKVGVSKNNESKYSCDINQLELGKTYYARAYAISKLGTAYSNYSTSFTTHMTLAEVTTQEATEIDFDAKTATLHGTIVNVGEPSYTECGFVYDTSPNPTINDNKLVKNGMSGDGAFKMTISTLSNDETFYIRSYAINEAGIAYGNEVVISPDYVVISSANIMVQRHDMNEPFSPYTEYDYNDYCYYYQYEGAKIICEKSRIGGYKDWRLPTIDELVFLYNNQELIGAFSENESYWSSTIHPQGYHAYGSEVYEYEVFDFYYGEIEKFDMTVSDSYLIHKPVRAVRTIK